MGEIEDQKLSVTLREEGNVAFKNMDWKKALELYTKALDVADNDREKANCYKNRAAVFLKLQQYEKAIEDASEALSISPNDPKALFRRYQALEQLNRLEEAYKDASRILLNDPHNKEMQPALARLRIKIQESAKLTSEINSRVMQMFKYAFNPDEDTKKREAAFNNLLVLATERNGANVLYASGVVSKIKALLKSEYNENIYVTAIRIMCELLRDNVNRCKEMISSVSIRWFFDICNSKKEEIVQTSQYCIQTIINTLAGLQDTEKSNPNKDLCNANRKPLDGILKYLVENTNSRSTTGLARDAMLQLITRNVHHEPLEWAVKLVNMKGLQRIMEVASELTEFRYESCIEITDSTKALTSVCLSRVYDNMYHDKMRELYVENINEFIQEKMSCPDSEAKIRLVVSITALLLGPLDVGNSIIAKDGIMEMILAMATMEDVLRQKICCECIIAAATKPDKAKILVRNGTTILKKLYQSKNENIRIRALVGLCKLGSSSGTDASDKPFAVGSNKKLVDSCLKYLINSKDKDIRMWAVEGLSFLTLDAEVKEIVIKDSTALQALINVARVGNMNAVYGIVTTFVNLCNAYDKKEILPEMKELAKFAKTHVPVEHPFDQPEYVMKRINAIGKNGITVALVALAKTDSNNCKELICRVFNALCSEQKLRGLVVQQGGVKVLLSMASEGTVEGKKHAAQALARIGITMDPMVVFQGQRYMEAIRPFLSLLDVSYPALMNFEGLMALCNLANINEEVRRHMVREGAVSKIEHFMYEDHVMLRRAATQCMANLTISEEVQQMFEGDNDKFKFIFLLFGEEDTETATAAGNAIVTLTVNSNKCCAKLFEIKQWEDILKQALCSNNEDLLHRAVFVIHTLTVASKEYAEKIYNTEIFQILMAHSMAGEISTGIMDTIKDCFKWAQHWNIITKSDKSN